MPEVIISNTSPLFYLYRIGKIDLLKELYSQILIPREVALEIEEGFRSGVDVPNVKSYPWIEIKEISSPSFLKIVPDLGKGEAAVLALAIEYINPLLIIDDALARRLAHLNNQTTTGTLGILVKSKQKGFIIEIKPLIDNLLKAGFYLKEELQEDILRTVNEY